METITRNIKFSNRVLYAFTFDAVLINAIQFKQFRKHFEEALAQSFDKESDSFFNKQFEEFLQDTKKEMNSGDDKITSCMLGVM